MKILKGVLLMALLTFLSACWGGNKIEKNAGREPALDVAAYFNGPIKAWGIVQDYTGKVTRQFDIDLVGTWDGDTGTLQEYFRFYDGETQERTWNLKKVSATEFHGTAGDIVGTAIGKVSGNSVYWTYTMDLQIGDSNYKIAFDDRMFLMNDGVIVNRAFMKKFGLKVGELTVFMQKQN